jgi:hypothetical protein
MNSRAEIQEYIVEELSAQMGTTPNPQYVKGVVDTIIKFGIEVDIKSKVLELELVLTLLKLPSSGITVHNRNLVIEKNFGVKKFELHLNVPGGIVNLMSMDKYYHVVEETGYYLAAVSPKENLHNPLDSVLLWSQVSEVEKGDQIGTPVNIEMEQLEATFLLSKLGIKL